MPYKKVKYKIFSIDSFIEKLSQQDELKKVLFQETPKSRPQFEQQDSLDSSIQGIPQEQLTQNGIKECFDFFLAEVRCKMEDSPILSQHIDEHMEEVNEYVMLRLYGVIFNRKEFSEQELTVDRKIKFLQTCTPDELQIPKHHQNTEMWEIAMKELTKIQKAFTPKTKAACISNSLQIIASCFNLFGTGPKQEQATTDDLLPIMAYVILHANVGRVYSHFTFIQKFMYKSGAGKIGEEGYTLSTFDSAL